MVDMPDRQMILTQYLVFNQKKQQALKKCLLLSVGKNILRAGCLSGDLHADVGEGSAAFIGKHTISFSQTSFT